MSDTNHPLNLEKGKEYEIVTRHIFNGTFVGIEEDSGAKVIVFSQPGTNGKGKPATRRVPFDSYVNASPTTAQRRKDES